LCDEIDICHIWQKKQIKETQGRVTIPSKSFPRKSLYKQLETVYLVSAQIGEEST